MGFLIAICDKDCINHGATPKLLNDVSVSAFFEICAGEVVSSSFRFLTMREGALLVGRGGGEEDMDF